ncbi:MAG TPA: BMP family ABC transporter substrate-binding protein [Methyloceanibacter sp.]|jgi:basic membrane protein A and related proteins|nr:BMP family ABC transporter substrate-binding protein [Methyloceanibacter sp.]
MSGYVANRREALKGLALLGAASLVPGTLPVRSARAADLTVGFVYIGPRLDWGWNQSHAVAAAALKGVPNARVVEADYLPESTDYGSGKDDSETRAYTAALENLISGHGAGLIISTSFDHDPFLLAIAKKYPDVAFRQASALANAANPRNVGSQNALINQGHYVNGVAAGLSTTTNKLGFVAGMPFGTVLLNVNSFLLGSRQGNPAATVRVIFTGGWEDEARDAAATNTLVDAGCDVITCHLDAPKVVVETAERRGVKTCGHAFDQDPLAPKGYITGADYNWTEMFEKFVETLQLGGSLPNFLTGGYDKDYVRSSPFGAEATPAAINAAKTAMQAMRNGDAIFVGPIKDNTGKLVVPAGTAYGPYADELQQTNYLIEGVIGSIA